MSINKVKLSQIIRDFIITMDDDDYVSNASDIAMRNFALRGIREIGFDLGKKIKSIKLSVESNDTITLPDGRLQHKTGDWIGIQHPDEPMTKTKWTKKGTKTWEIKSASKSKPGVTHTYTVIKTGSATFTVLASQTQFA